VTTVAVIGPGRVGTALAMALPSPAYEVVAVAGRSQSGLTQFTERVPGAGVLPAVEAAKRAELVLLCVPDDVLEALIRDLARDGGVAEHSRWVHTSGGFGHEVLRPARLAGAATAACHPAQTFPDPETGLAKLPGTSWAVTADEPDLGWAQVLVTDLRGSPFAVPSRNRTLYHAGLAVGSNATSSVVILARDLLLGAGVTDPNAFLGPLVTTSAANAAERGVEALTGPVRRGDAGTVRAHLDELATAMPEAVSVYVELARLALHHAERAGLDREAAAALEAVLDTYGGVST
jgi:predicted short-subunit dehydrogenase-like oxidoreductase (DUF2520 family)